MRCAAALLLLIAACSPSGGAQSGAATSAPHQATPSPSATAIATTAGPYAVIVKDFLQGGLTYTVSLVATDGHVVASASPRKRTEAVQMSNLSTSSTTLYYLDGDADIRSLRPDGTTALATHVALGPNQVAAFAVSPDNRRLAVAVLDYTRYPVGTRLYVEDLTGGGNHVELFSSKNVLEWPAGWHNGRLVIAIGLNAQPQNRYEGFMRGHGYHIADAQTGTRLLSLCDQIDSFVPESPAGTVCVNAPNASVVTWDGASRSTPKDGTCGKWGPLSPAGVMANRVKSTADGGCTGGDLFLVRADGSQDTRPVATISSAEGWMDENHLVVVADSPPASSAIHSIVDVTTGVETPIRTDGFFAAALPGGL
jgi:hypothetical protein